MHHQHSIYKTEHKPLTKQQFPCNLKKKGEHNVIIKSEEYQE